MKAALIVCILFPLAALGSSFLECEACQILVSTAEHELNITDVAKLEASIDKLCVKLPKHLVKSCEKLASVIAKGTHSLPDIILGQNYPARVVCSFFKRCDLPCCEKTGRTPTQVSTSLAVEAPYVDRSRVFRWVTEGGDSVAGQVLYGGSPDSLTKNASASISTYTLFGWQGTIHNARVVGPLPPSSTLYYKVGSADGGFSPVYSFQTGPFQTEDDPLTVVVVGDMGTYNHSAESIEIMHRMAQAHQADFLLHNGDISYADGNQQTWDVYAGKLEPTLSTLPMMVAIGNHEAVVADGLAMNSRYPMTVNSSLYYSYDIGDVHFTSLDSESVLDMPEITQQQLQWLDDDLSAAVERNASWIIVNLHRLLYCTGGGHECGSNGKYLQERLEPLFLKYRVDLVLQAHRHNYQSMYPMKNGTATQYNYDHPSAPVYLTNGVGGSREGFGGYDAQKPDWIRVQLKEWGIGVLSIPSRSVLEWKLIGDDTQTVIDTFTIKK